MNQIKTAILSYGMSGKVFHAPFLELHNGFEFVGAWERTKHELKKDYPSARRYSTLETILEDDYVELVVVNTPTYTHFEYAKRALEANKHVIVEKAFTTNVAEAEELNALAERKNLKLSVYQNRRWDSDFKTVQEVLNRGILGSPIDVSICFDRFNPILSPKKHKEIKGPGAGIVKDLGAHVIDQALHLFGFPAAVFGTLGMTRELSKVDDYFKILLFYPTFNVQVRGGFFFKELTPSFVINGTNGTILKSRADVQEPQLKEGMKPDDERYGIEPENEYGILNYVKDGATIRQRVPTLKGDYMDYYEGIHQSIVENQEVPVSATEGINVMKIIEAAFQSHKEKRVVQVS